MGADGHIATVGRLYGGEYFEGSRLARGVGTEESENILLADGNGVTVDRLRGVEALLKIGGNEEILIHVRFPHPGY